MSRKTPSTVSKAEASPALLPKLRFPAFSGQPWKSINLSDVTAECTARNSGRTHGMAVMGVTKAEGIVPMEERIIAADRARYKVVSKDWFAYNPMRLNIGSIARWHGEQDVLVSPDYVVFRCIEDPEQGIRPDFLDHFRTSDGWQDFVNECGLGSVRVRIYYKDIARLELRLPELPEQQRIADCLSSLDELIAAQGRKVEAIKTHKQGLMQQLFPREGESQPRLRFPEFLNAPDWEVKQLEDLAKRGSGHTPSKLDPENYNGGIKWISLADSKRLDAGLISTTEHEISAQGIKNSSAVLHPAGTVLISRDAGVGKSAVMALPMAVSQHFIVWSCHAHLLSNWFLYYLLQEMKPLFERIATGSTIKTIGLPFFKNLLVAVPTLPEQQRIADCLMALDTLITAATQVLDNLKTHKQGLMQQLFPSTTGGDAMEGKS